MEELYNNPVATQLVMIYNNYVAIHGKNALKGLSQIFFFK